MLPPRIAKLAGLGAYAACGGFVLLFLLLAYVSRPTPRGGIDTTQSVVAWIALGGVFLAIIGAHLVIGRRLLAMGRNVAELP